MLGGLSKKVSAASEKAGTERGQTDFFSIFQVSFIFSFFFIIIFNFCGLDGVLKGKRVGEASNLNEEGHKGISTSPPLLFLLVGLSWFAKILIYLHLIVPKDMNTFVFEIVVNLCEESEFGIGFLERSRYTSLFLL